MDPRSVVSNVTRMVYPPTTRDLDFRGFEAVSLGEAAFWAWLGYDVLIDIKYT